MIVIKKVVPMPAFQLGTFPPLEQQLIQSGLLLPLPDDLWRVKTRETKGDGELAHTGDYIKLDSIGMPYPAERAWFEANHTKTADGMYLQTAHPRKAWCAEELMCPEIKFLVDRDLLQWDRKTGFGAQLWGTWQTAAPNALIVFDAVKTDHNGNILHVDFHFVAADEFENTYEVLSD